MMCPPYFADEQTHKTYLALKGAMTHPGQIHHLPETGLNMVLVAEALLNRGATYYTSDSTLKPVMNLHGAQERPVEEAFYQFYPTCDKTDLEALQRAPLGTPHTSETPTLIIGCLLGYGESLVLHSPEIEDQRIVHIDGLPDFFWHTRRFACRFGLGWDVYFVDGPQVIGLPRCIHVDHSHH